jgi:glycerophosphoryl diester phosphodiesterase
MAAKASGVTLNGQKPIVIGHRGAAGYRPEHTLASYALAIDMGADFIEPDLVSTRDGVLIARHEPFLGIVGGEATTDVASHPEFADRVRTFVLDGRTLTGWWAQDFTLAEIKTLRAIERLPLVRPANAAYDGLYQVPTFQEVIDLARQKSTELGRTIGIYPETKHPTFHDARGLSLEEPLVDTLKANRLAAADSAVFIQSFEVSNLRELYRRNDISVPLVQLLGDLTDRPYDFVGMGDPRTYGDLASVVGLDYVNDYAQGIGPDKTAVIPRSNGMLGTPTSLVADAHEAGLLVHPYTFRLENVFLPNEFDSSGNPNDPGNLEGELKAFLDLGVDGFFTDNPDIGARVISSLPEKV